METALVVNLGDEGLGATASFSRKEGMGFPLCPLPALSRPVHPTELGYRFGSGLTELQLPGKDYTFSLVWSLFPEGSGA